MVRHSPRLYTWEQMLFAVMSAEPSIAFVAEVFAITARHARKYLDLPSSAELKQALRAESKRCPHCYHAFVFDGEIDIVECAWVALNLQCARLTSTLGQKCREYFHVAMAAQF